MRYLIAPDKFKGTLSAVEVAQIVGETIQAFDPAATIELLPIADGGEGTAKLLATHAGAERRSLQTVDALGRPIVAEYFIHSNEVIFEMSETSGLWRISDTAKQPLSSSTYGTGIMLRHLIDSGIEKILIGLGGSATVDVGIGMAAALGYQFLDENNEKLDAIPANFSRICAVNKPPTLNTPEVVGLFDVETRLTGIHGATYTFGPQKGLTVSQVIQLDSTIASLVICLEKAFGTNFSESVGSGAAGGFGYGIKTFLGGSLCSGFEMVSERLRLTEKIGRADVVVTGEGKLDAQTLQGKGPIGVAQIARRLRKPVWALAGNIADRHLIAPHFDKINGLVNRDVGIEQALKQGKELLRQRTLELLKEAD
jgi:glycerate kinase